MLLRGILAPLVAVILGSALACPVAGQTETFDLQLKLEQGETVYYTYNSVQTVDVSPPLLGVLGTFTTRAEGRLTLRVLAVDLDGIMTVEAVVEDLHISTDGRTKSEVGAPATVRIRPDGTFVEPQGGMEHDIPPVWAVAFPGHPVSVGESWSIHVNVPFQSFAVELNPTFTLTGVDQTGDGRAAHIRTRVDGTVKSLDVPGPGGNQVHASGTEHGSGEDVWSVEHGRLLRSESEETADFHLETTAGGRTVRSSDTTRVSARLEALPPEKVAVAAVGADALIVPGTGIGQFVLDQGMSSLVDKFGSPGSGVSAPDETMWGVDRGFRSAEESWRNGLVAYVDWDNRSSLFGLGVADGRFRTDKGLGFGSSEGAVLFAHGMSPARVDMKSGQGFPGVVQVLIYDEQGIAYGIAVEDKHSTVKGPRAPVGAVAWIVVFPPGSAGDIFPIP